MLGVIAVREPVRLSPTAPSMTLPLGLPWLGAHFRLDALPPFSWWSSISAAPPQASTRSATAATRRRPHRVLPFYPAYLAAMNLVVLANDAFTFLVSWEFMSLTSWALVIAHHRERENMRAGYVYLLMASFGTLALLLALRPARRPRRQLRLRCHARRASVRPAGGAGADPGADRRRLEGRRGAAARLAAARASGRAEPCLRADERGDDQGRGLRLRAHRLRSAWARRPGGGACWCSPSAASPR